MSNTASTVATALHERSEAIELGDGLHVLPLLFALDGRMTTHPLAARGVAPMNVFVLTEPEEALVIETGMVVHQQALLQQLDALLAGRSVSLRVSFTEFFAGSNARAIAERHGIAAIYMPLDGTGWVDFLPGTVPFGEPLGQGPLAQIDYRLIHRGEAISIGSRGRELQILDAPLRLTPGNWAYDEQTKTLFTAEAFTHLWRPDGAGPWIVESVDDGADGSAIWEHMINSRYWWLPGADTEQLRRDCAEVFESYDVHTIAPMFGCVLKGREVVERHVEILDDLLAQASRYASIGLEVGSWPLKR